jgi:hypothetical protein
METHSNIHFSWKNTVLVGYRTYGRRYHRCLLLKASMPKWLLKHQEERKNPIDNKLHTIKSDPQT